VGASLHDIGSKKHKTARQGGLDFFYNAKKPSITGLFRGSTLYQY
jgi:hypothetical protein